MISKYTAIPTVTSYENVIPSDAANGNFGLPAGIARLWTAGNAMYDAAPQSMANNT